MNTTTTSPPDRRAAAAPTGLEGVVVADTAVGDVRGDEGYFHYRGHDATDLARRCTFEQVWALLATGRLIEDPTAAALAVGADRDLPPAVAEVVDQLGPRVPVLDAVRTALSAAGAVRGWGATSDLHPEQVREQTIELSALVPTLVARAHRRACGLEPVPPHDELSHVANYLWMLHGTSPDPIAVRALEQYLILTVDHGFNASTFTARVITSTGADVAAAVVGALGALSGPLHGGAPSRALEMLDLVDTPDAARGWVRTTVAEGGRVMGFGHRVYTTHDPRSVLLRRVASELGGHRVERALAVESAVVEELAALKPGRDLYTNVEFYAGVVMDAVGIPAALFTPTFAVSRVVGWGAHVVEQASDNRLIRPAARYVDA